MELRIKPFPKNNYPKKGLLIKGSSPVVWLQEIELLDISLRQVKAYAIPSDLPNVLYGCFLIFDNRLPQEIGRNAFFQEVDDKLFIPENTTFYPRINPEDWQRLEADFLIMHPEFGMVKLSEQIDWSALIMEPGTIKATVRKPLNGVQIPRKIERYTVEMDDDKVLEALQPPKSEEEWMNSLPFDLKKVMAGNKKEIEKYLNYIEKYPERAIDLGVPLDILGTSRGDGFAKFTWLEGLFGNNSKDQPESAGTKNFRRVFWSVIVIAIVLKIVLPSDKSNTEQGQTGPSSGTIVTDAVKAPADMIAFQSGTSEIDRKIDSLYHQQRKGLGNELLNAGLMESRSEKDKEDYKKSGGRNVNEIGKDLVKLGNREKNSRDSLKIIYTQKITKYLVQGTEKLKRKISDSLKQYTQGKAVNGEVIRYILKKKQALVADSLGRLYGTIDLADPASASAQKSKVKAVENNGSQLQKETPVSDILYLVILMIAAVGLYSFIFKRKSLSIGGDSVPGWIKLVLIVILVAMLVYLFYPLVKMFGYNWFVWALVVVVVLLLYRLFREDKTILNSEDDE
ncbi:APC family permease [Chryseobacterium pennipullorum]|uniref:APC family permease n=1 Tax=Chryseobacterium pennipullorum TaxID=2258963 RepID=A0A3D9B4V4_9FLAO|nr:APC family permease [Chryseobacterium pennipullorum]REC48529.1 APC family permease [Chryseobacterium pennipullorum]